MTRRKTAPAPAPVLAQPAGGGSYLRLADGSLVPEGASTPQNPPAEPVEAPLKEA